VSSYFQTPVSPMRPRSTLGRFSLVAKRLPAPSHRRTRTRLVSTPVTSPLSLVRHLSHDSGYHFRCLSRRRYADVGIFDRPKHFRGGKGARQGGFGAKGCHLNIGYTEGFEDVHYDSYGTLRNVMVCYRLQSLDGRAPAHKSRRRSMHRQQQAHIVRSAQVGRRVSLVEVREVE
jgi:hypothetical protein